MKKLALLFATIFVVAMAASAYADPGQPITWYDSFGFEPSPPAPPPGTFLGPIHAQGFWPQSNPPGWVGTAVGTGVAPSVVPDPTGMGMGQVVEFVTGPVLADTSQMDIFWPGPVKNSGATIVELEFEIFRTELNINNFWWWTPDAGNYTYGLEWDQSLAVHPFGWNPGAGQTPATLGGWDHIALEWNFANQTVSSWVNGIPVDVALPMGSGVPPNPPLDVTGFSLQYAHDGVLPPQTTVAYVDNFLVTYIPEPGTIAMLVSGLIGLFFVLRRRVK